MSDSSTKIRPIFVIQGTPIACMMVPHKTDDDLLMLKSPTPEGGAALAQALGVEVKSEITHGRYFFMVEVDRQAFEKAFAEGAAKLMLDALANAEPTKDAPEPTEELGEGESILEVLKSKLEGQLN